MSAPALVYIDGEATCPGCGELLGLTRDDLLHELQEVARLGDEPITIEQAATDWCGCSGPQHPQGDDGEAF